MMPGQLAPIGSSTPNAMIRRPATAAGIATKLGDHSFRAPGITAYLKNGGTLAKAAAMANHAIRPTADLHHRASGSSRRAEKGHSDMAVVSRI